MKKITLISLMTLVLTVTVQAEDRSEQEMLQIASQQLNATMPLKAPGTTGQQTLQKIVSAESYNIYTRQEGEGFVVVSRDDMFTPVLGYSETAYDPENVPEGLQWWLTAINESLAARKAAVAPFTGDVEFTPVENFVDAKWGQDNPYNYLCPKVGTRKTPTGCAATALAQLLFYYQYPESSTGSGYHTVGSSTTRVVDELETTFQWDKINATYRLPYYSTEAKTAIGELMRDCGSAVGMMYNTDGSGAYPHMLAMGMVKNLRFDALTVHYAERDYYSDAEWMSIIYHELAVKRPILYGGQDNTYGGHAFLFSGVDDSGKIYVNWGWDGLSDGFYDMADLAPSGILGMSGTMHFNTSQHMAYGATPVLENYDGKLILSELGTYRTAYTLKASGKDKVALSNVSLMNIHYKAFDGKVYLRLVAENGDDYLFSYYTVNGTTKPAINYYERVTLSSKTSDITDVPAGTYRAYLVTKANGEDDYQYVRVSGGAQEYTLTKASDGTITLSEPQVVAPHAPSDTPTAIQTVKANVRIDDGMTRVYAADGRMVYQAPTAQFSMNDVQAHGLVIVKSGSKVSKVVLP